VLAASSGALEIAAGGIGRQYGVDWLTVVAVPRSDFMGGVTRSFLQGMFIAIMCVIVALVLGLAILNRVLDDLRKLTEAARRIGDGEPLPTLNIRRRDEIGQLAMSFSEMEYNLRIDKLTAVFNRASLIAQIGFLRRQLEQKTGDRPSFALLFIDLDRFKAINDQYGHGAGDKVLITVATRLRESVRVSDVVARYGGDEFVVLLKGVTAAADVIATEEKIRQIVEEPVHLEHAVVRVGVSIGWAMFPEDGEDVDALLKIADKRMFDTKKIRKAAR
jgi:diguanylate cyclase (GGDEF)-like protein